MATSTTAAQAGTAADLPSTPAAIAVRASILHCVSPPSGDSSCTLEYLDDGLLVIRDGIIEQLGDADALRATLADDVELVDRRDRLLLPGFVDAHIHYPQTDIIGSYGKQLLEWLQTYTFPAEMRFADVEHAREVADFFIDELLRNGTTSAQVLGTVHAHSVDAIFQAAATRDMRLTAGKVMMDRHCPEGLQDTPESAYEDSKALIEQWHGHGRLRYAITPRFAPTSTNAQLERAGQLAAEHPDVAIHTHLAENRDEVEWVASLFPNTRSYLDVYRHFDLLRERAVYAHCIHLDEEDRRQIADCGAAMAFCPTANTFLGSGLFDLAAARRAGARVGLGTDVGGGTSFSMLATMAEAYKVVQLSGQTLPPGDALYLATLGSAEALYIDERVGNFLPGKEADFVVIDERCTPLMARRRSTAGDWQERLFALCLLGDDRAIEETWVNGRCAHRRDRTT